MILADTKEYVGGVYYGMNQWLPCNHNPNPTDTHTQPSLFLIKPSFSHGPSTESSTYLKFNRNSPSSTVNQHYTI
ncbi:hypothetical protein L1987_81612 [Smallanthus sonchifolius]|uniref:Uncharacterized protein n=1 Tax=Smallanthus sonchifolius TaxID=185202 RepID=A0ACB8YSJ1_9ASTR|nr:hypothetical protein L1987_81612 [Smallanthus sonchifolius]